MLKKIFVIVSLVLVLAVSFLFFFPVKRALKRDELYSSQNYILVRGQKSTVSQWVAIEKSGIEFEEPQNYKLMQNHPEGFNYSVESAENIYVCFGEDDGTETINGDSYNKYNVKRWEILYPIKRNSIFAKVLPKSYLALIDYIH